MATHHVLSPYLPASVGYVFVSMAAARVLTGDRVGDPRRLFAHPQGSQRARARPQEGATSKNSTNSIVEITVIRAFGNLEVVLSLSKKQKIITPNIHTTQDMSRSE